MALNGSLRQINLGVQVLCEGDTRNRWRDGQVCPDVRQGTMAPWARRLGREEKGRTEKVGRTDGKREESRGESGARLVWRKGLSPEIGVKKTRNASGVENEI
ncbi:hypothetical protein TNCV_858171 [Trichonephila clavipes]|nr:hypothetical protein TNCV_858171 [Trichonephila clavipes]